MPTYVSDNDNDGSFSAVLLPVQKSGTGKMTNRAWVTDAELIYAPTGQEIRLVKGDATIVIDQSDIFVNASSRSLAITGSHVLTSETYPGNPYFVVQEYSPGDVADFEVDMSWSCASAGTAVTRAQGWQFSLADIGCTDFNQSLTLRYYTIPNRVEIEQYGNPHHVFVEPTTTVLGNGRAFVMERYGLTIDATLLSWSSTSATVRIDEVSSDIGNHCSTGTYTFYAE